jgi:hypothetical protein
MIAKIYYTIWTDCIKKIQTVPASKNNWKLYSFLILSNVMGLNLVFLSAILPNYIIWNYLSYFKIDCFKGNTLDSLFNGLILFMLPMFLINYFLVFRNDRYKVFIEKYQSYNGNYFKKYLLLSCFIPLALLFLGMLYVRVFSNN